MSFKLEDYSNERIADIERAAVKALTKVGLIVESSAKTKARFRYGQLRDSIDHKVVAKGKETVVSVGTDLDHGFYNEFGTGEFATGGNGRKGGWFYVGPDGKGHFTRGMTPQPFIRPAFRENTETAKTVIGSTFREEFGR